MDKGVDKKREESGGFFFRRLLRRHAMVEDACLNARKASSSPKGGVLETSQEEMVFTKDTDDDTWRSPEYVRNTSALLSLQPWIFKKESCPDGWDGNEKTGEIGDNSFCTANRATNALQPELSPRSIGLGYKHCKNRSSLKSRQSQRFFLKPLSLMEDCFVEEYLFTSLSSSPASSKRPFLVTDGDRVISKSGFDSSSTRPGNGLLRKADEVSYGMLSEDGLHKDNHGGISLGMGRTVVGLPPLPKSRRQKRKSREMQLEKLETAGSQKSHKLWHSQGSFEGVLLFCLGISFGIAFAILSNRTETERLKSLLEHTKDLVQDLQEELDMKDSFTVKELSDEGGQRQEVNCVSEIEESQCPAFHLVPQERDERDHPYFPVALENSESLSNIEAELEVELERLEQNMKACSLERRMSDLSVLDPDLVAVVHGELGADIPDPTGQKGQMDATTTSTSTPQAHEANHPVSPKELSLRIHEVIQWRLEERVKELERALQQSQRQLQMMENEQLCSQKTFSNSDVGSSCNLESPMELDGALVHPLCLNLSGDALDAYDEAYEEFMGITEMEDDNLPSSTSQVKQIDQHKLCPSDPSLICGSEKGEAERLSAFINYFEREPAQEQISKRGSSHTTRSDGEDNDDTFDEEEEKLIQQIVERKRQGSSVFLNAQKMLFLLDD